MGVGHYPPPFLIMSNLITEEELIENQFRLLNKQIKATFNPKMEQKRIEGARKSASFYKGKEHPVLGKHIGSVWHAYNRWPMRNTVDQLALRVRMSIDWPGHRLPHASHYVGVRAARNLLPMVHSCVIA